MTKIISGIYGSLIENGFNWNSLITQDEKNIYYRKTMFNKYEQLSEYDIYIMTENGMFKPFQNQASDSETKNICLSYRPNKINIKIFDELTWLEKNGFTQLNSKIDFYYKIGNIEELETITKCLREQFFNSVLLFWNNGNRELKDYLNWHRLINSTKHNYRSLEGAVIDLLIEENLLDKPRRFGKEFILENYSGIKIEEIQKQLERFKNNDNNKNA